MKGILLHSMKRAKQLIVYSLKDKWLIFLFVLVSLILTYVLVANTNSTLLEWSDLNYDLRWWSDWADPLIGFGIFLFTMFLALTQLREEWEGSLDKRLTVVFKHKDRIVLISKMAYLSDEADIRNLAQQIGAQMAKVRFLDFEANNIQSEKIGIIENPLNKGEYVNHYMVFFQLMKIPTGNEKTSDDVIKHYNRLKTETLMWREPDIRNGQEVWILSSDSKKYIDKMLERKR